MKKTIAWLDPRMRLALAVETSSTAFKHQPA
jgi:hypothetical protein